MKVLIIDSSTRIIDRLEEILSETQIRVIVYKASSYTEAGRLLEENKPDVVLLDISLPDNKSFALVKEIKKTGSPASVIVMSIHTDNYIREQYSLLGADFFFDKYHDFDKIPGVIDAIAAGH